jgi:hypothetical protein
MTHQPASWQYGFEACGAATKHQLCLRLSTCSLDGAYLARHCGGCNPGCDLDNAGITPADLHLDEILRNVGGLAFDIRGFACATRRIPDLVPLVWDNRRTVPEGFPGPLAVSPQRVFPVRYVQGHLHCTPDFSVRRTLYLPDKVPLWLSPGAPDEVLEWMWENPDQTRAAVASNGFAGIASPHFSVYGDQCPLTWCLNMKRMLVVYSELREASPTVVATVTIPNEFFAEHWAGWVADNPAVNVLAVNTQMWRDAQQFNRMLSLFVRFASMVSTDVHYVVFGPSTEERVALVRENLPRCTIVSSYVYNQGRAGQLEPTA